MSAQLILPSTIKPSPNWRKRAGQFAVRLARGKKSVWRPDAAFVGPEQHPGRKIGKPEGTHVLDLVALRKALVPVTAAGST
jgi:hypothetical protein